MERKMMMKKTKKDPNICASLERLQLYFSTLPLVFWKNNERVKSYFYDLLLFLGLLIVLDVKSLN
jgi:hypothetical protein